MRYSSEHKAATRRRVLKEAAKEVRTKGPDGVAVAAIMARAGLTHGAFYAHFASKDALVAEAVDVMFTEVRRRAASLADTDSDPKAALRNYVTFYLSPAHRDRRDRGCPLPALATDMDRTDSPVAVRFSQGVEALASRLAEMLERIGVEDATAQAHALLAQLVGAITLARALGRGASSDAMLQDTRARIFRLYGLDHS